MVAIETARLLIRSFRAGDAEPLREMILQKEASKYAIYDHEWPTSEEEVERIAEWFASGESYLAVCLKETGAFIGFISLNGAGGDGNPEFDLGYCLDFRHHGNGYATEGCGGVVDYAFCDLGAERVTGNTAAENHPSCRLLNRLGMQKIGESRASFRKTADGQPIEFAGWTFALTRDEWSRRRRATNGVAGLDLDSSGRSPRQSGEGSGQ